MSYLYEYKGQQYTFAELLAHPDCVVSRKVLSNRLQLCMPLAEALTRPKGRKGKPGPGARASNDRWASIAQMEKYERENTIAKATAVVVQESLGGLSGSEER